MAPSGNGKPSGRTRAGAGRPAAKSVSKASVKRVAAPAQAGDRVAATRSPAPPRRRQEDRSAATRARLLESAIQSLYTRGYAATTTMVVAEDAGVSRGAMLHQFPTRVELMLYVFQGVYEADIRAYVTELDKHADSGERLRVLIGLAWERLSSPSGIAVLELMIGARSDPELASRLEPLRERIERESFQVATVLTASTHPRRTDLQRMAVWAMRGLALARVLSKDHAEVDAAYALLAELLASQAVPGRPGTGAAVPATTLPTKAPTGSRIPAAARKR